jgi:hypothetical protein
MDGEYGPVMVSTVEPEGATSAVVGDTGACARPPAAAGIAASSAGAGSAPGAASAEAGWLEDNA